jgi:NADH-quinone oxidoreductase subunit C
MDFKEILQYLEKRLGRPPGESDEQPHHTALTVAREDLLPVVRLLRREPELACNELMCLSGMDYTDGLGVVYHLYSHEHRHAFALKVRATYEDPEVPSVTEFYGIADWQEREAYDMFGLRFTGHPDLTRILCPEDWVGHPLRKDYVVQQEYRGMPVPYPEEDLP